VPVAEHLPLLQIKTLRTTWDVPLLKVINIPLEKKIRKNALKNPLSIFTLFRMLEYTMTVISLKNSVGNSLLSLS